MNIELQKLVEAYKASNPDASDTQIQAAFSQDFSVILASLAVNYKANVNPSPVRSFVSRKGTLFPKG